MSSSRNPYRINSGRTNNPLHSQPTSRQLTPRQPPSQTSQPRTNPSNLRPAQGSALYHTQTPVHSSEHLLPPRRNSIAKGGGYRDNLSRSPEPRDGNSRRTSWSSGSEKIDPFSDSRSPSRAESDDENINTQTVSEKYNITPSDGLLLFPEDVEKDDYLHTPDPNDRDRMEWTDLFSKRGLINVGGLTFLVAGILVLFIGYPVLTFVKRIVDPGDQPCSQNPLCLNDNAPLMKNMRSGLIDPDTPDSAMTRTSSTGGQQSLIFSDEFNYDGRTFYDGDDPFWAGVNIWYGATMDIEWYDPDAITTRDGALEIRFDAFQNHGLNYRSGMLQSWNKMCFKGGYMEASISLPGRGDVSGFWPGFWAMGNLGRPGYLATTDGMWPYSYSDICDAGITANQSDPDGLSWLPGMKLPACTCDYTQHPSPGISRSAPEIDAIEATVTYLNPPAGDGNGVASQSFQMAPFDILWRANSEYMEIYDRKITETNAYQGGPFQQALSSLTNLNNNWYDGKGYQKYAFEYTPGSDGFVVWYVGDAKTWKVTADAIGPNGNIGQRIMPEEPMSLIVNFGMADGFAPIDFKGIAPLLPATMRIDYVRIYQDESGQVTCDPEGYPTTEYIAQHPKAYLNPNVTHWKDAGYEWPKNSYVDDCSASGSYRKREVCEDMRQKKRRSSEGRKQRRWPPWW